jgi:hypothetical protein
LQVFLDEHFAKMALTITLSQLMKSYGSVPKHQITAAKLSTRMSRAL